VLERINRVNEVHAESDMSTVRGTLDLQWVCDKNVYKT